MKTRQKKLGFFKQRQTIIHPLLQEMQKKSHKFWDNTDIKCSPVTPSVLGIHSAVQGWWACHESKQDNSPNFQAGQQSCLWGFKVPNKTSPGYQNTGEISRRYLRNTMCMLQLLKCCGCPSKQGKISKLEFRFQATGRRNNQRWRKKKASELRKVGIQVLGRDCWRTARIPSSSPPSWARGLPSPGLGGAQTMQQSARRDFYGFPDFPHNRDFYGFPAAESQKKPLCCDSWAALAEPLEPPGWRFKKLKT